MNKRDVSLDALNGHLFDMLAELKLTQNLAPDKAKVAINTAKAMSEVGRTIIDTYKLKVDALRVLGGTDSPLPIAEALQNEHLISIDNE